MKIIKIILRLLFVSLVSSIVLHAEKYIVVDLDTQMAHAYEDGESIMSGRVSTGKQEHRTPEGSYTILQKKRYHKSNLWPKPKGGAKMDYMLRLTNSGIAMHLGPVPQWPASHGCIRMKNGFAQKLWRWASVGTEVEVSGFAPDRVYQPKLRQSAQRERDSFFDDGYIIEGEQ